MPTRSTLLYVPLLLLTFIMSYSRASQKDAHTELTTINNLLQRNRHHIYAGTCAFVATGMITYPLLPDDPTLTKPLIFFGTASAASASFLAYQLCQRYTLNRKKRLLLNQERITQ